MKILVAGELNPDIIMRGYTLFPAPGKEIAVRDLDVTMGSASAICAMGLARLGDQVSFFSKVGRDIWGDFCLGLLERAGIDASRVLRDPQVKTGVTVSISSERDRALVTYPGAMALFRAADFPPDLYAGHRHLHMASYYLQESLRPDFRSVLAAATRAGLSTSLDTGYDDTERWEDGIRETLREADLFFPNQSELAGISGRKDLEGGLRALENGRTRVVVKLGAEGAAALHQGRILRVPSIRVQPVDTTGAGDSFNAGFLHAWLRGFELEAALRFANVCGALSTLGMGGVAAQPTEAQVLERMEVEKLT